MLRDSLTDGECQILRELIIFSVIPDYFDMISRFFCGEIDQRLSILEYDGTKCSGRYRAVIDGDQATVLQLQSVDTKDVPLSQLALCPGLTETEVLQVISHSDNQIGRLLIEKVEEEIVYRWDEVELIIKLTFDL